MMRVILAAVVSLGFHALVFAGFSPNTQVVASVDPESTATDVNVAAAQVAYAALDQSRAHVAATERSLAMALEGVDLPEPVITPTMAVPIARPAQIANRVEPRTIIANTKPQSRAEAPRQSATPPTASEKTPNASSNTENAEAAYRAFGEQVHGAYLKALRTPNGVSQLRAKIQLQFVNGRYQGAVITQSSGNSKFDKALLSAAKRARFPSAPRDLSQSANYNIPVKI